MTCALLEAKSIPSRRVGPMKKRFDPPISILPAISSPTGVMGCDDSNPVQEKNPMITNTIDPEKTQDTSAPQPNASAPPRRKPRPRRKRASRKRRPARLSISTAEKRATPAEHHRAAGAPISNRLQPLLRVVCMHSCNKSRTLGGARVRSGCSLTTDAKTSVVVSPWKAGLPVKVRTKRHRPPRCRPDVENQTDFGCHSARRPRGLLLLKPLAMLTV